MIAALFVQRGGVYYGLPDVDPWDEERDARLYAGPWPVVAHPPCARWCLLAGLVEATRGKPRFEDGGCFASALASVRRWGGILEHPAFSHAWWKFGLPRPPTSGGWVRGLCGGWSCHIEQGHFGHAARKPTWLYAFGVAPPSLPWGPAPGDEWAYVTAAGRKGLARAARTGRPVLWRHRASVTPVAFRDLLLEMARGARRSAPGPAVAAAGGVAS